MNSIIDHKTVEILHIIAEDLQTELNQSSKRMVKLEKKNEIERAIRLLIILQGNNRIEDAASYLQLSKTTISNLLQHQKDYLRRSTYQTIINQFRDFKISDHTEKN